MIWTWNKKSLFLIISSLVFIFDLLFVLINYHASHNALFSNLEEDSKGYQKSIELAVSMINNNMLQLTTYIAQDNKLNQLFLKGKKAVEAEGGGAGKAKAAQYRQDLLNAVLPSWKEMQKRFKVRQLHYHLGPGSTSFLRVHKPKKFGDNMDEVRYTVVNTNELHTITTGFETGRVYSGLRGVTPIFTNDPDLENQRVFVGALETGTSFSHVLSIVDEQLDVGVAVLLTKEHVKQNMWPEAIKQRFADNSSDCECYVEASSRSGLQGFINKIGLDKAFLSSPVRLIQQGDAYLAVSRFPLRDFRGLVQPQAKPVGGFVIWNDVTEEVNNYHRDIMTNIIYAILGFIVIECLLLFGINQITRQLQREIDRQTEQLRMSNEQKDNLLSILAHDVRNLFNPIIGFAHVLEFRSQSITPEQTKKIALELRQAGQWALTTFDTLLNWARLSSNRFSVLKEHLNIHNEVEEIIATYRLAAEQKKISLINSTTSIEIDSDLNILKTLIRNMIGNAIKYTSEGQIEVGSVEDGAFVTMRVSDTGSGMSEEKVLSLFNSDDVVDTTPGTQGEVGTGLGLRTCQELVKCVGGHIWAESKEGEGTSIYIQLPKA